MTDRDRQHLHRILDQHNDAFAAFRAASDAFDQATAGVDETMDGLRRILHAMQNANRAQGDAIERLQAANHAALALLNNGTT